MKGITQGVRSLLNKEMDRRDFLKHVGVLILALFGITALFETLKVGGDGMPKIQKSVAGTLLAGPGRVVTHAAPSNITYMPGANGAKGSLVVQSAISPAANRTTPA